MSGELWRQQWQVGVETTPGTPVAATRKMYFDPDSVLTRTRQPRPHMFSTGTRDNIRAFTLGPEVAGGTLKQPLSASEIIELLLMGIDGTVTPTQPDAGGNPTVYLWTFKPGNTLKAATVEFNDGAIARRQSGVYVNKLEIAGSVREQNTVTADLFGLDLAANALTGGLTDRTPDFIEGWEAKLWIDAFGGTPGTTQITGELINWNISIDNQMARKYFAQNTNATQAITIGELKIEAKLLFEAAASQAATEYSNWDAATKRLARIDFGNNALISGTYDKYLRVDIPGAWSIFDLGQKDENTRAYELTLQYVYDVTNAFGLQITAQNNRSAAW